MIAAGSFPPSVTIREVDFVRSLGMSRTPVREALHRLNAEGLIRPLPSGGYTALELGARELADVYQVREVLTGLAARLAAEHRSRVDIARLEDVLDATDRAISTKDDALADEHIREFYRTMSAAGGNHYLHALLVRVIDLFRYPALAIARPGWHETNRPEQRAILDAIVRRDADGAERLARKHIARALAKRIGDLHPERITRAP